MCGICVVYVTCVVYVWYKYSISGVYVRYMCGICVGYV